MQSLGTVFCPIRIRWLWFPKRVLCPEMAIHDAIVIVLCWFAFFVSMPIHLKFLGEKGFAKATKVLHHLCKNVGASRPRASLKPPRFQAKMRCILCCTIEWLSLLSTFQECALRQDSQQVYTGVATTPAHFQCAFKLPRFYNALHWPSYFLRASLPWSSWTSMILTTIFYGRRFPDRAERQWFWPRFSTGVASLIELNVNAYWPSFSTGVASPDRATSDFRCSLSCLILTHLFIELFDTHPPVHWVVWYSPPCSLSCLMLTHLFIWVVWCSPTLRL